MDYEKKYNEALERAKKLHKGLEGYNSNREVIENIFPELRESDDERIRKELIEYHKRQFENNRDQEVGLFHKGALAWLEKQKEQKKKNVLIWGEPQVTITVQKPEWSEEDEHRRTDAIYFLESAKSHYADTSEIEKTILWLKSLRPSWKPSEMNTNCQGCLYWTGKCKLPKGLDCPEKKEQK